MSQNKQFHEPEYAATSEASRHLQQHGTNLKMQFSLPAQRKE
jgi:hypothetical protein